MLEENEIDTVKEYVINNVKYTVERSFSETGINLEETIINYLLNEIVKN